MQVLELEPGATLADVQQAFTELVEVWSPEKQRTDSARARAERKVKEIGEAFAWLAAHPSALSGGVGEAAKVEVSPTPVADAAEVRQATAPPREDRSQWRPEEPVAASHPGLRKWVGRWEQEGRDAWSAGEEDEDVFESRPIGESAKEEDEKPTVAKATGTNNLIFGVVALALSVPVRVMIAGGGFHALLVIAGVGGIGIGIFERVGGVRWLDAPLIQRFGLAALFVPLGVLVVKLIGPPLDAIRVGLGPGLQQDIGRIEQPEQPEEPVRTALGHLKMFRSAAEGFEILMPANPDREELGAPNHVRFKAEYDGRVFLVTKWVSLVDDVIEWDLRKQVEDQAEVDGGVGLRIGEVRQTPRGEEVHASYKFGPDDQWTHSLMVIASGKTMYKVGLVTTPEKPAPPGESTLFLSSFHLTEY